MSHADRIRGISKELRTSRLNHCLRMGQPKTVQRTSAIFQPKVAAIGLGDHKPREDPCAAGVVVSFDPIERWSNQFFEGHISIQWMLRLMP